MWSNREEKAFIGKFYSCQNCPFSGCKSALNPVVCNSSQHWPLGLPDVNFQIPLNCNKFNLISSTRQWVDYRQLVLIMSVDNIDNDQINH